MRSYNQLIDQLQSQVAQQLDFYSNHNELVLSVKFERHLFSEDRQSVGFYSGEITQTLSLLMQFDEKNEAELVYLIEKLLAQNVALNEAIQSALTVSAKIKNRPQIAPKDQLRSQLDQLPPRERLDKYYDYLQQFNQKIQQAEDQLLIVSEQEQARLQQFISLTKQRRQRCLDAIEVLEDYLAFKEKQE
ncbi:MAG: primosomal replication protein PriC [Pasteurellaceae bacterium]|nr:primosomal replication protein PriC [Pasteurellaceae bacterium]